MFWIPIASFPSTPVVQGFSDRYGNVTLSPDYGSLYFYSWGLLSVGSIE